MTKHQKKGKTLTKTLYDDKTFSKLYKMLSVPQINYIEAMAMLSTDIRGVMAEVGYHETLDKIACMMDNLSDAMGNDDPPLMTVIRRLHQITRKLEQVERELSDPR